MPAERRAPLTREESLKAVVVRNPKVTYVAEEDGGHLEMTVTVMGGSWLARLFGKGTPEEQTRKMQLDAMGAFCWEQFDGERTVEDAAKALAERDDLSPERAEESLWRFLRMLSQRGLVALSMPKTEGATDEAGSAPPDDAPPAG
ncbi:MAG: PqqD family protein [Planctomycetota bacterium]|jgi:hypothetical protein